MSDRVVDTIAEALYSFELARAKEAGMTVGAVAFADLPSGIRASWMERPAAVLAALKRDRIAVVDIDDGPLWDLVEKWRDTAERNDFAWISDKPEIAAAQAFNAAAEDLSDWLLAAADADEEGRHG